MTDVRIVNLPISVAACIEWVNDPGAGGLNVFIGTVRESTKGKKVIRLEFEAYEIMALMEMKKIADVSMQRWPLKKILIHHRTGILKTGDIPVIIAVSASHREAAFNACRYIIDTLKQVVPIWKKEVYEDGEEWVAAHP